jgi:hypothetical protein
MHTLRPVGNWRVEGRVAAELPPQRNLATNSAVAPAAAQTAWDQRRMGVVTRAPPVDVPEVHGESLSSVLSARYGAAARQPPGRCERIKDALEQHPRATTKLRRGLGKQRLVLSVRLRRPGLRCCCHSVPVTPPL